MSGLTPNRFGSGGLKSGGGANVTDDERPCVCSSLVLTEVEVIGVSEELDVALTETVLLGVLRKGNVLRIGVCGRLRAVAMVCQQTFWRGLRMVEVQREVNCNGTWDLYASWKFYVDKNEERDR